MTVNDLYRKLWCFKMWGGQDICHGSYRIRPWKPEKFYLNVKFYPPANKGHNLFPGLHVLHRCDSCVQWNIWTCNQLKYLFMILMLCNICKPLSMWVMEKRNHLKLKGIKPVTILPKCFENTLKSIQKVLFFIVINYQ